MTIRRATGDDATRMAEIMAIVSEEGTLATEPPVDVPARAARFREGIESGRVDVWVLEEDGEAVGHIGLERTRIEGVRSLGITILDGHRGHGGGRALLDAAIAHARATGAHKIELEVWPDNARAIAFYVSAGFEWEGVRRDHYRRQDGSLRSAVLMGLLL